MHGLIINDTAASVTITLDKAVFDPAIIQKALKILEVSIEPIKPRRKAKKRYLTGKELAKSELVGIWKDRDIQDSVEYVNELQRKIERRERF